MRGLHAEYGGMSKKSVSLLVLSLTHFTVMAVSFSLTVTSFQARDPEFLLSEYFRDLFFCAAFSSLQLAS